MYKYFYLVWILLGLACGSAKSDAPANKAKGGLDLASGSKPTLPLPGVKFDDPVAKALEKFGATEPGREGGMEGYEVAVQFGVSEDSGTKSLQWVWATWPASDQGAVTAAFEKAWGKGTTGESSWRPTAKLVVGPYEAWRNPDEELEVKLFFTKDGKAGLLYSQHVELGALLSKDGPDSPARYGAKLGDPVSALPEMWRDGSSVKTRHAGEFQLNGFAFEGTIKSFTIAGIGDAGGRAAVEAIWGKGTDAKSKMDAPVVVWTNAKTKVKATLDGQGRLEFTREGDE